MSKITVNVICVCVIVLLTASQCQTLNKNEDVQVKQEIIYLADLTPTLVTNFYGEVRNRKDSKNKPIAVQGIIYKNGIMMHAPAKGVGEVVYNLDGIYNSFNTSLVLARENGSVIFRIYGDGEELYASPVITYETEPIELSLKVLGINELKIELDNENANTCDLAILGDPHLIK